MATTTLPTAIAPEAAARVAELGLQREFDLMLAHIRKTVAGLRSISVELSPPYDTGDEPCVLIWVLMDDPHLPYDPTQREWGNWKIQTFSPDVHRHFVMLAAYGPESSTDALFWKSRGAMSPVPAKRSGVRRPFMPITP